MNLRRLFNIVFVTLFCHEPLVCVVAESVDAAPLYTHTPDDVDYARETQQILSEAERIRDSVTEMLNEVEAQILSIKELESYLEEMDGSKKDKNEESKKDKMSSIPSWWRFGPLPRWITEQEEEEEVQVINEGSHTLGCCFLKMLQLLLLILQQIWNITIILCSDLLSWTGSGWQHTSAIDFSIFSQILGGLLLFLMLNSIAYVLIKAKSAWERNKSFVLSFFKLPIFVCAWSLSCFVFSLLKKTMVIDKKRIQKPESHMKMLKKEMAELKGVLNDYVKTQQERDSLENEVRALKTQLQQLRIANHPAQPTPERQNANKNRGRAPRTRNPRGGFNNLEGIRGGGRNGPYQIHHNTSRTRWRVQDEVGY